MARKYPVEFSTTTHKELYLCWQGMHIRCRHNSAKYSARYSDRGITVCPEWNYWPTFATWALQNGFSKELLIDRIDNDKGYFPGNCRFVTRAVSNRNRDLKLAAENIRATKTQMLGRPFVCVETGQRFMTLIEAHRQVGVQRCSLRLCLRGKHKQAGGFHWAYINTEAGARASVIT